MAAKHSERAEEGPGKALRIFRSRPNAAMPTNVGCEALGTGRRRPQEGPQKAPGPGGKPKRVPRSTEGQEGGAQKAQGAQRSAARRMLGSIRLNWPSLRTRVDNPRAT